jgi:type IV pilus assembly protein PilY1
MNKKKLNLKNIFNFVKINILIALALSIIVPKVYAKPIPPGSGEGDVPANILFLLDSSLSMDAGITGATDLGLGGVDWAVELADGNIIVGEPGRGAVKILTTDNLLDNTFAQDDKNFLGSASDPNCASGTGSNDSWVRKTMSGDISSNGTIWFGAPYKIVAIDENGICVAVIPMSKHGIAWPKYLEIRNNGTDDILIVAGRTFNGSTQVGKMYVMNIGSGSEVNYSKSKQCPVGAHQLGHTTKRDKAISMTVSKNMTYYHFSRANKIFSFKTQDYGNGIKCPINSAVTKSIIILNTQNGMICNSETGACSTNTDINSIYSIRASSDDDDILYLTSKDSHTLQKIELDIPGSSFDVLLTAGKKGNKNSGDPGTILAANIRFDEPGRTTESKIAQNLWVSSSTILATSKNGTIQLIDEDQFNSTNKDTAWQAQYGGGKATRFTGAIEAIESIISDSSLQAGANFGFGHWNGGEHDHKGGRSGGFKWRNINPGEGYCHQHGRIGAGPARNASVKWDDDNSCYYYRQDGDGTGQASAGPQPGGLAWKGGTHPEGTSGMCTKHSCLNVAVHRDGFKKIPDVLGSLDTAYATDSDAFADVAHGYFTNLDGLTPVIDPRRPCQLHYVIVISDGRMWNEDRSIPNIKDLRQNFGVRTLFVAYGGSYTGTAVPIFDRFAQAGSCDTLGAVECEATIEASTPQVLKDVLDGKIRQIIADRLSFSAPSITASLQEGGSVYQAQFNYEQNGEWKGRLLRKAIKPNNSDDPGAIADAIDPPYCDLNGCNWDAGKELAERPGGSETRNIWTALDIDQSPGVNYVGNWNNWQAGNYADINFLFERTGNTVLDYHNESSTCAGTDGVADGNTDDQQGLINFVRGKDYFDYNGGCVLDEDRASILADIYHSQMVEVGPPGANTLFTSNNQEAYWRASQGYAQFKRGHQNRARIIYAGSNGGMLHAFNAVNGKEEWAFIPPMVIPSLPLVINKSYDGAFKKTVKAGGSNAIFGVDGSPVIHDAKIKGLKPDGTGYEIVKTWRTLLFIPYGRGGAGFSVLDVTNPIVKPGETDDDGNIKLDEEGNLTGGGKGPLHMFTIFNDKYNKEVIRIDHNGVISSFPYDDGSFNLKDSEEGVQARNNQATAKTADGDSDTDFTERDLIAACKSDDDFSPDFRTSGNTACYKGTTFTFSSITLPEGATDSGGNIIEGALIVSQKIGDDWFPVDFGATGEVTGKVGNDSKLTLTFKSDQIYNKGTGTEITNVYKIETSCEGAGTLNKKFDYSQLGETWSTPRILRVPQFDESTGESSGTLVTDRYVAVMGAGYPSGSRCSGSGVYFVDLEGGADQTDGIDAEDNALIHEAGKLYGTELLGGALKIVDSDPDGKKIGLTQTYTNGSNIKNAVTANPIVITADAVGTAPWRGGLVYINDMEGKITKINLTSDKKLFDQQAIMNLKASDTNKRLSYFEMDAAMGTSTGNFWLFGGTGDFNRISEIDDFVSLMDNIVYGIRDYDFPYFIPHKTYPLPLSGATDFVSKSMEALENGGVPTIESLTECVDVTGENFPTCSVGPGKIGWRYHLGIADGKPTGETDNMFRKTSAPPTIYRGKVYFPVYQPDKDNNCNLGTAFICAHDDECGSLDSQHIKPGEVESGSCYEHPTAGILSKLVVYGTRLFANLAGPSEDSQTLVEILANEKQYRSYRKSWRENY